MKETTLPAPLLPLLIFLEVGVCRHGAIELVQLRYSLE